MTNSYKDLQEALSTILPTGADDKTIPTIDITFGSSQENSPNPYAIGPGGITYCASDWATNWVTPPNIVYGTSGPYAISNNNSSISTKDSKVTLSSPVHIEGDNPDLFIGGKSLVSTIERIESRLNILRPNLEIEKEWDELRELGDRYRTLEKDLEEKIKTWDILKKKE